MSAPAATPQHTPGQWCCVPSTFNPDELEIQSVRGQYVAGDVNGVGNANLIAAAPDLLSACKAVVRWAKEVEQRKVTMPLWCGLLWSEAIGSVNDAIAKARGNQ